jgi:hypothetical protein
MNAHVHSYKKVLAASERVRWRVEDLINDTKRLDFARPFLPETLARVDALDFLDARQRTVLNQIRGHNYLYLIGLVEEFILPFVLDHARDNGEDNDARTRALLTFATEEAKHIDLFKRLRASFLADFATPCEVIGPAKSIAEAVLAHDPLSVALVILHIEWMTQRHFLDSIKDDRALDPVFKDLLRHHWMEEAQHAQLDTLMVEDLAAGRDASGIAAAIDGYLAIGGLIDGGLEQQVAFDLDSFERATGRVLTAAERARATDVQTQAMRWTFLGSGMTNPSFVASVGSLSLEARTRVETVAPAFC